MSDYYSGHICRDCGLPSGNCICLKPLKDIIKEGKDEAWEYAKKSQVNPGCLKEPYFPPKKVDKKYDTGKPMVGLVKEDFPLALLEIGKIARYGILKYEERGSWKKVEDGFNRYKDALGRHDLQSQYEDVDDESGHLHLAHMAWNCLALLQFHLEKKRG